MLFSGDHVMAWSTPIVAPPDGAMSDYMASLRKARAAQRADLFPRPRRRGAATRRASSPTYILHRKAREASILHRLAKGEADIPTLVRAIYIGLDPRLIGAAGMSVLAHLEDLVARGAVATDGPPSIARRLPLGRAHPWPPAESGLLRRRLSSAGFSPSARRCQHVVDILEQAADARGVGAEIVAAVARGRAHVDARALARRPHAHHDVVAEAHDRRARHRLDRPSRRPAPCGGRASTTSPFALGDDRQRGVIGDLRRHAGQISGSMSG